eukprot:CAMPEP_0174343682 /NCGR_PEP_ID=MMETSP0810-20121108/27151_1 /TAXON_ID=73025 ORGANISM="Eutreptiella gymnastica-like, Strain CCMP1594" /NCGR_SAMPLE_ID=MMETSP0810 /ASSEMBLY_ACC=CAM_ASM_000659 /LENGTH=44 /DNA_ID= /DNA_START= /DNA_END= /DNA_ORIENTATION=
MTPKASVQHGRMSALTPSNELSPAPPLRLHAGSEYLAVAAAVSS